MEREAIEILPNCLPDFVICSLIYNDLNYYLLLKLWVDESNEWIEDIVYYLYLDI